MSNHFGPQWWFSGHRGHLAYHNQCSNLIEVYLQLSAVKIERVVASNTRGPGFEYSHQ